MYSHAVLSLLATAAFASPFIAYTADDGLPQSQVIMLAQDTDGALWMATMGPGLVRFDGNTFDVWRQARGMPPGEVVALLAPKGGGLYAANDMGLFLRDGDVMRAVALPPGSVDTTWLTETSHGVLAIVGGVVVEVHGDVAVPYPPAASLGKVFEVVEDTDGRLWASTATGLVRADSDHVTTIAPPTDARAFALAADPAGGVWLARRDPVGGLYHSTGDVLTAVDGPPVFDEQIYSLYVDPAGDVWGVTNDGDVWHRGAQGVELYEGRLDLPQDAYGVLVDREGNVFVGSDGAGLLFRARNAFRTFVFGTDTPAGPSTTLLRGDTRYVCTFGDGLWRLRDGEPPTLLPGRSHYVWSVIEKDQTLWVVGNSGLDRVLPDGTVVQEDGLPSEMATGIVDLGADLLVTATSGVYRGTAGSFKPVPRLAARTYLTPVLRSDGTLWLGARDGTVDRYDPSHDVIVETIPPLVPRSQVDDLVEGRDGTLWLATPTGLVRRSPNGELTSFGAAEGLPDDAINFVTLNPDDGAPWVGTNRGIATLVDGVWRVYDNRRGLPDMETNVRGAHWEGDALWVGTAGGFAIIEPAPPSINRCCRCAPASERSHLAQPFRTTAASSRSM